MILVQMEVMKSMYRIVSKIRDMSAKPPGRSSRLLGK